MRLRICVQYMILGALPLLGAAALYRSNDFGMQLEPIPSWRRDELKWVLEVTAKAGGEVRRLFQDGKESRRWEITGITDGGREEKELAGGALAARRMYAANGALIEEDQYSKGKLAQKSLFTYASSRLVRVRVLAPDGTLLYAQDYFYTSRGSLREVRRAGEKEEQVSSFVAGRSGPSEEWNQDGDDAYIARYDGRGRAVERVHRKGKDLVSQEDFVYREDTDKLLSSVEKRPADSKVTTRTFDSHGRLESETVALSGKVVEEAGYSRDEKGRVIRKLRRGSSGLEEWRYTLDEAGKTTREEYLTRGSLEKITSYGPDNSRTEELYSSGVLFLKVFYEGDLRTREEVWADGKKVRDRSFD